MKKVFLFATILFGVLFFGGTSSAETINAASCSQADVQSSIDSVSSGDTIIVPVGSCTWDRAISIPDGKKITLQGEGKHATVITASSMGQALVWPGMSGSRITGIDFADGIIYPVRQ